MQERLAPEEARREAQFIQEGAQGLARMSRAEQADAADYEKMSSALDAAQHDDPPRYDRLLRIGELANEVKPVDPKLREAFVRIVEAAAEPVKDTLKQRADDIQSYLSQQQLFGRQRDVARKEKITQVVDEYLSQVLERVDRALMDAPEFKPTSPKNLEDLGKLKHYHLSLETQAIWKDYVAKVLERLTG